MELEIKKKEELLRIKKEERYIQQRAEIGRRNAERKSILKQLELNIS